MFFLFLVIILSDILLNNGFLQYILPGVKASYHFADNIWERSLTPTIRFQPDSK